VFNNNEPVVHIFCY